MQPPGQIPYAEGLDLQDNITLLLDSIVSGAPGVLAMGDIMAIHWDLIPFQIKG